jgi:hypothetical protein
VRINRAAYVGRRVRPIGTNELSGGEDDDEDNGSLLQSLGHWLLLTVARKVIGTQTFQLLDESSPLTRERF